MSKFLNGLTNATNYTMTENQAVAYKSTRSMLLDMFAMGAAYRTRSDEDCFVLFDNAFKEDPLNALKCLFYIRSIRNGQGERRFFRVVMKWLATQYPDTVRANLAEIVAHGRWDDLYTLCDTPVETDMFAFMKRQFVLDASSKTPSLLAKWLKSENTSSKESVKLAKKTIKYFEITPRQYRKILSMLRERIKVLERLMSAKRWDEIEFDKIPSRAGMIYRNAFARHDVERMKMATMDSIVSYSDFAKDTTTKVNAKALYPYECVAEALKLFRTGSYYSMRNLPPMDDTQRLMVNKYWDNLTDYFKGASFNGIAVVDTSGSMVSSSASAPINVAISLGLYTAEKAKGPFAGHYISFASRPQLIKTEGVDFCDKVQRIYRTNLVDNTNIEATFDLLLDTAIRNNCSQDEIPQNVIVISDMEFDSCAINNNMFNGGSWRSLSRNYLSKNNMETLFEAIEKKWAAHGYKLPHLIFWNVQARQNNIPMIGVGNVSYVSGFSPSIFEQIMTGKTGYDLMMDKLNSAPFKNIKLPNNFKLKAVF